MRHQKDSWAPAAQEQFIIDFKDAGFKHVRIPVTWHERTANLQRHIK